MSVRRWTPTVDLGEPPTWSEVALWSLLVALAGADAATTTYALLDGPAGSEPAPGTAHARLRAASRYSGQIGYAGLGAVVWQLINRRRALVLAVAVVLEGLVVLNNAAAIVLVG